MILTKECIPVGSVCVVSVAGGYGPPCGQIDTYENITFQAFHNFVCGR